MANCTQITDSNGVTKDICDQTARDSISRETITCDDWTLAEGMSLPSIKVVRKIGLGLVVFYIAVRSTSAISEATTVFTLPSALTPLINQACGSIVGNYSGGIAVTSSGRELKVYPDSTIPANTNFYIGGMFVV